MTLKTVLLKADDQDAIAGIVEALFGAGSTEFKGRSHHKVLRANDRCRVRVLKRLKVRDLTDMGISMGDAMEIMDLLHDEEAEPAAVEAVAVAAVAPVRRPELRAFPALGSSGYPALVPWQGFRMALRARLHPVLSVQGRLELSQIEAGGSVSGGWTEGCPDDVTVFTELVNGPGCVPDDLMQKLPSVLKKASAGMALLQHINSRVAAVSESATAVQEEAFKTQRAVLEGKKHLMASVYSEWQNLRLQLEENGEKQSAANQRASLRRMIAKLPEVKTAMDATEAAYQVTNPDKSVLLSGWKQ